MTLGYFHTGTSVYTLKYSHFPHRYDASAKLAEESHNAARTAPLAIIFCVSGGGVVGFVYLLSITFSIQDPASLLDPNATFGGTAAVAQVQAFISNDLQA